MGLPIIEISLLLLAVTVHVHPRPQNGQRGNFDSLDKWFHETVNSMFAIDNRKSKSNRELSKKNGFPVDESDEDTDESSDELEEYVEDDIIISLSKNRNGVRSQSRKWPRGVIHYHISSKFSSEDRKLIKEAMETFHKNTCIRFQPYTGKEQDYVRIRATTHGCSSHVGRSGGRQNLNLSLRCRKRKGTIIHELMHAIGFHHEQCRSDRDRYISVMWDNIKEGQDGNLKKYKSSQVNDFGVDYDYGSVMHYAAHEFSSNGKPTIIVNGGKNVEIGQRKGLSAKDIKKIRIMYNCKSHRRMSSRFSFFK